MHSIRSISKRSALLLVLLLALLGAQTIESAHQHAVGDSITDCLLCHTFTDTLAALSAHDGPEHRDASPVAHARGFAPTTAPAHAYFARGPPLNT
jgi:hypothetical protein